MTEKDKKIIEDSERDGIPIFVLTAKDSNSLFTLMDYEGYCISDKCIKKHIDGIRGRIKEFKTWQETNPSKVKLPD